jgi:hypothetical protein
MPLQRGSCRLLTCAMVGLMLSCSAALAQRPERGRGEGFERRPPERGISDRGRGAAEGRFMPTREQLDGIYQRMTERYLERFEEVYQLNDEQREKVSQRLDRLREQQSRMSPRYREEAIELLRERRELYQEQQAGNAVDEQRLSEVAEQLQTLRRRSPLFNFEEVIDEVESLLPPEQVELGREFRERWQNPWQERFSMAQADGWDRYVERFARTYQLDASQRSAAESLARDFKEQREAFRDANRARIEAVQQVEDRQERQQQLRELNAPIEGLFAQLRERLMQIPTSAQKLAVEATTRPAEAAAEAGPVAPSAGDPPERSRVRRIERRATQ